MPADPASTPHTSFFQGLMCAGGSHAMRPYAPVVGHLTGGNNRRRATAHLLSDGPGCHRPRPRRAGAGRNTFLAAIVDALTKFAAT